MYDTNGQRVRKVWEKSPGLIEERIYLGGFEIFRQCNSAWAVTLERETLHILDDNQRIAMVETRTIDMQGDDPAPQQLIRYQFSNHLRSASLELDDQAQIISYEEYTPYGSTSYQGVRNSLETNPKRYRYTSKERDDESGLYYNGVRYYTSWLGMWVACDPGGMIDGTNLYRYIQNNPLIFIDATGKQTDQIFNPILQINFEGKVIPGQNVTSSETAHHFTKSTQENTNNFDFFEILPKIPIIGPIFKDTMPEEKFIKDFSIPDKSSGEATLGELIKAYKDCIKSGEIKENDPSFSEKQKIYGKLVEKYSLDRRIPAGLAILLNPSGGLTGPGGSLFTKFLTFISGSSEAITKHSYVHDALGWVLLHVPGAESYCPGYNYGIPLNEMTYEDRKEATKPGSGHGSGLELMKSGGQYPPEIPKNLETKIPSELIKKYLSPGELRLTVDFKLAHLINPSNRDLFVNPLINRLPYEK